MTDEEITSLAAKLAVRSGFVPRPEGELMQQASNVIIELLIIKRTHEEN
jgi:hypothetical protein